jgi:hypothetical protein
VCSKFAGSVDVNGELGDAGDFPSRSVGRRMTRFCFQCNRIIGEKCAHCGTEATANSNGDAVTGAEFDYPSCSHHFPQGDGGETGGMCEPCFDVELQKTHEQAALIHP